MEVSTFYLAEIPPTVNITAPVTIIKPIGMSNRTHVIAISITGANTSMIVMNITNNVVQNSTFSGSSITIPTFPNNDSGYVEIS